jgi:hypothetical protein
MGSSSVEACCEAPEVFELVEAAFDPIAVFVEVGVVRDRDLARRDRWDDGEHAGIGDELAKMVAVVGFVSNYGAAVDALKQRRGGDDVVDLSAGENEAQRPTKCIGKHMDFAGQSSSGSPQSLVLVPPFPVAACWWARTNVVSSMRYSFLRSLVRTLNTRSQTPLLAHRAKRVWTLFHIAPAGHASARQSATPTGHR